MKKKRDNKRIFAELMASLASIAVVILIFLATSIAWFTSSISSAGNVIKAGTLSMEVKYFNDDGVTWSQLSGATGAFKATCTDGTAQTVYIEIKNAGTLSFDYDFTIAVVSDTETNGTCGSNNTSQDVLLSDYFSFGKSSWGNKKTAMNDEDFPTMAPIAFNDNEYTIKGSCSECIDGNNVGKYQYIKITIDPPDGSYSPSPSISITMTATAARHKADDALPAAAPAALFAAVGAPMTAAAVPASSEEFYPQVNQQVTLQMATPSEEAAAGSEAGYIFDDISIAVGSAYAELVNGASPYLFIRSEAAVSGEADTSCATATIPLSNIVFETPANDTGGKLGAVKFVIEKKDLYETDEPARVNLEYDIYLTGLKTGEEAASVENTSTENTDLENANENAEAETESIGTEQKNTVSVKKITLYIGKGRSNTVLCYGGVEATSQDTADDPKEQDEDIILYHYDSDTGMLTIWSYDFEKDDDRTYLISYDKSDS